MLPLFALAALLASASAQELPASAVPASTYGPPAPIPEATALSEVDGTAYVPYPYGFSDPGFSVQTGYEGYLVPIQGHSVSGPATLGLLASLLPLPKLAIKLFPKVSLFLAGFLFLLLIGGAFTTAVCAFTPFCTITFLGLGLRKSNVRSFLTKDRLTETTAFVLDAIDKYKDFTKKARRSVGSVKDSKRRRR